MRSWERRVRDGSNLKYSTGHRAVRTTDKAGVTVRAIAAKTQHQETALLSASPLNLCPHARRRAARRIERTLPRELKFDLRYIGAEGKIRRRPSLCAPLIPQKFLARRRPDDAILEATRPHAVVTG
jgi:hypothetical protein